MMRNHSHGPASAGEATHVCWGHSSGEHPPHQLHVDQLTVSYGVIPALCEVTFSTECGRSLALIGPNGAGKSTLLKTLAGVMRPERGTIRWRDAPLTSAHRELAYLPQRGEVDWSFPITVRGLIEMGRYPRLSWWRSVSTHDREIVERALSAMKLQDVARRQISALSGGQQQRTFIARALAQEAHVLLLDEPFAGLDQPAEETLRTLLHELAREGRLIIASHHDLESVPAIFDDVLILNRAAIAFGPAAATLTPQAIAAAYGPQSPRASS